MAAILSEFIWTGFIQFQDFWLDSLLASPVWAADH